MEEHRRILREDIARLRISIGATALGWMMTGLTGASAFEAFNAHQPVWLIGMLGAATVGGAAATHMSSVRTLQARDRLARDLDEIRHGPTLTPPPDDNR